jgi:nitrite reductase (NO-forming)
MRAPLTALLAASLLMAGCATDADEPAADEAAIEAPTSTGPDDAAPTTTDDEDGSTSDAVPTGARETDEAGDVEIDIKMFDFVDGVVEISVGQTVTWTNQDNTRHTVTSGLEGEPNGTFDIAFGGRGDTASVTFDEPGEYHYFCGPHNFMTGTVVVTE